MSEYFDSDDPFADLTADDLSILEQAAHAATQPSQSSQRQRQPPQLQQSQLQQPLPPIPPAPSAEDDYAQFNVDEEDLILDPPSHIPLHPLSRYPPTIDQIALLEELASLRAQTTFLKTEHQHLQTRTFTQDGKLEHLARTLARAREEHESALARVSRAADAEKRKLEDELAERERRVAALQADVEFQRSELREARQLRGVVRPPNTSTNGGNGGVVEMGSPRRARVVKGSGVKSPEAKSRVTRAFAREGVVGAAKKRKREERMETPEPVVVEVNEGEITRLVLERVLKDRSSWTPSDERFQVNHIPLWTLESGGLTGQLLREVLGFRMDDGMEVFSALAEVSYSNEQHSISSLLIHEITTLAAPVDGESALANILVEILCSHWNRCLHQELVPPHNHPSS
jgi:hypothetical protein